MLAGFLRLYNLGKSPPGLNQDEATNAWNAYCLLKTGTDQTGVSWPVFYMRCLGGNSSTLFIYFMIPFQAIGGLNIFTTRLPGAAAGIFTVFVIYLAGKRLFDRQVGLMAAFLLALNPWQIQQGRWGHEATLCALLGITPLAMLLWARMPIYNDKNNSSRPFLAVFAGIAAGICCYGYQAVRIFIPVFLSLMVLLTLPGWWRFIKTRKGIVSIAAFVFGFLITFGPLAWQHIFHPEGISQRSMALEKVGFSLSDESIWITIKNVLNRYIHHFGPDFLFIHGDHYIIQSPPGFGQFHGYMLPLMILGLVYILRYFKSSPSVRTLLAFIIAYPVGDIIYSTAGIHSLRSAPGMCSLILLGAVGAVFSGRWLWKQNRQSAVTTVSIFAVAAVILNAVFFNNFYVKYNRDPDIYHAYHTDLVEACQWLKPRLKDYDGVFFTTSSLNMPYAISLVTLGYDPKQWFEDKRDFYSDGEWEHYTHYGKMYFMYNDSFMPALMSLRQRTPPGRALFIVRPGEFNLANPIHRIVGPYGLDVLWICEPAN